MAATEERQSEVRFGIAVLAVPLVLLLIVELSARWLLPNGRVTDFDWRALRLTTAATPETVPSLFRPNSSYRHLNFNSLGLRGPELDPQPAVRTIRLAFLGDSTVLNAVYPEEQTLAAQVTTQLHQNYPGCTFDYATFAGPGYSLSFLTEHWTSLRPRVSPDITIALIGSPYEAVGRNRRIANGGYDWFEETARAHFATIDLFDRVKRRVSLTRFLEDGAEHAPGFSEHVEQTLQRMGQELGSLTPDDAVIIVGHRARVRDNLSGAALAGTTRYFRNVTRVKQPDTVVDLVEQTVAQMRDAAEARGWDFTDPLARIPADKVHFRDALHLSEAGIALLARLLVEEIAIATPACTVEVGS